MQVADCLSRLPDKDTPTADSEIIQRYTLNLRSGSSLLKELSGEMHNKPVLRQVYHWLDKGWSNNIPKQFQRNSINIFLKKNTR